MTTRKGVKIFGTLGFVVLLAAANTATARDAQHRRGAQVQRSSQSHTRTTERQRTDNGHTRTDTWTGADGRSARRDATVTNDREAGTRTRNVDYTTADGREGSKSDVVQRTDDGYTRDTTRTLPNGTTQTRNVDVSCDKDAAKCVKQVEVGKQP